MTNYALWIKDLGVLKNNGSKYEFMPIISSDGNYPETVMCKMSDGSVVEMKQVSPRFYVLSSNRSYAWDDNKVQYGDRT